MKFAEPASRGRWAFVTATLLAVAVGGGLVRSQNAPTITQVLGRPTWTSMVVNARPSTDLEIYFEYGLASGRYTAETARATLAASVPGEFVMDGLAADEVFYYRARYRSAGTAGAFAAGTEASFHTPRSPGSTFTFALQGDSHPEREKQMFSPDLYTQTLAAVAADHPDFYLTLGDDFSVDTLPSYSEALVAGRYTLQLPYLSTVGRGSPLFLVNGNHEQGARYLLDGTANNVAVWAQNARNRLFPQPAPDGFYSGNSEVVPFVGLLRNYYAWEWGDALFVVIDPYWESPVAVDSVLGGQAGSPKTANKWQITHGDAQYQWLSRVLGESRARWKFVFAHHVMGTGRGGVEVAPLYEWGGLSDNGQNGFAQNRPTWTKPIHQLFVDTGVTAFFHGHDHLFAHQSKDGVVYQEVPNPADNTYTAFNADAYTSGDVFPNAGYVRVTVAPGAVKVDYVREFLPKDEHPPTQTSGMVQFSYTIGGSR